MRKSFALLCAVVALITTTHAQVPCPVMLVSGSMGHDAITVSFRNKGKLPIEQLRLLCKPATGRQTTVSACAAESSVFYPGMQYSIHLGYPNPGNRPIIVSVAEVVMSQGEHWDLQSADKCRALRVSRK